MPTNALDNILPGPELDALTAQKVFGWKNVHKHDGALVGKKQDKAGRWRTAKVPQHSTEPVNAYTIDERMKQLGRSEQYAKELSGLRLLRRFPSIGYHQTNAAELPLGRWGSHDLVMESGTLPRRTLDLGLLSSSRPTNDHRRPLPN